MNNYSDDTQHISIDETATYNLLETARWAKFLAIVCFVGVGLMIIGAFSIGAVVSAMTATTGTPPMPPFLFGIVYIFAALVYIYPVFAQYKFATLTKRALNNKDKELFNKATGYLKGMFKYVGILMIVMICIYAIAIIFALTIGVAAGLAQ